MRKSKVLQKLRAGKFARICGLGHYLPFFVRHAAHFKYDGIWLDLEHRAMDDREVQSLLAACNSNDIDCMVRPPTLERTRLYRYLEDGATGLMIPFASSVEVAKHVVDAIKFPPVGNRGVDGAGLDGGYYLDVLSGRGEAYFKKANRETFIVAQIETREALDNIDAIAAVPGIDMVFVGPADLTLRLAVAKGEKRRLADAVEAVRAAAARHGKTWGVTAGSIDDLVRYRKLGAQMVPRGGDYALFKVLEDTCRELDKALGE
jgi:2-keto-3-deoxy-L-rhamnonate aldolase RhmA